MAKTFIYKGAGAGGQIPLGPERVMVRFAPGVPFTVPDAHAARFEQDNDFEAVHKTVTPAAPKGKAQKGGDDQ